MFKALAITLTVATILVIALSSCSHNKLDYGEFNQYVQTFRTEQASRRTPASMQAPTEIVFGAVLPGQIAVCHRFAGGNRIVVSDNYWKAMDNSCRELLMMHELGHCMLRLPHSEVTGSIMFSGMNPYNCSYYQRNRKALLDELFAL